MKQNKNKHEDDLNDFGSYTLVQALKNCSEETREEVKQEIRGLYDL